MTNLAARQHGLVDRATARTIGASDHEIRGRSALGRIEELHPGVYYLNCTPATRRTQILAGSHGRQL